MREEAAPLLAQFSIEVVRFTVSVVPDEHSEPDAVLVRSFRDLESRAQHEADFYGSDAWRSGPREAILACIETFHTVVIDVSDGVHAVL
jgi:hypothetical protein